MTEGEIRVGIIGLGVGEQHIAGWNRVPGCRVVALCDFDPDKLAAVGSRNPSCRVTPDAAAILDDPGIDAVSIASFDEFHAEQIVRALEAGKHVFAEKPICLTRAEAETIRATLARHPGLRLSSNLVLRRCPRFVKLRGLVRSGALGRLHYMEGDYDYGRLHKLTEGWRGRPGTFYSVVYGGAIHLIDLLLWLSGDRVVEVTAFGNRICTEGTRFAHRDLVAALLRFESGAVAKVTANFGCVHPHFHAVELFGTEGTFINALGPATLYRKGPAGPVPEAIHEPYPGVEKGALLDSFVAAIRGRGEPDPTEAEVFAALAVAFAIETAAETGASVPVHYL